MIKLNNLSKMICLQHLLGSASTTTKMKAHLFGRMARYQHIQIGGQVSPTIMQKRTARKCGLQEMDLVSGMTLVANMSYHSFAV